MRIHKYTLNSCSFTVVHPSSELYLSRNKSLKSSNLLSAVKQASSSTRLFFLPSSRVIAIFRLIIREKIWKFEVSCFESIYIHSMAAVNIHLNPLLSLTHLFSPSSRETGSTREDKTLKLIRIFSWITLGFESMIMFFNDFLNIFKSFLLFP